MTITNRPEHESYWRNALTWQGSVTPRILGRVLLFVSYGALIAFIFLGHPALSFDLGPFEVSGAVLGVLLVQRINAGYERWWEARKIWGGIVNQSRNIVISAMQYGPKDLEWKKKFVGYAVAFSHTVRCNLRGQKDLSVLNGVLSENDIQQIVQAPHMPGYVGEQLAKLLQAARVKNEFDGFAFMQVDRERALLIDYAGACERILKTPIPLILAVQVQGFILVFLLLVPFVLLIKVAWFTPLVMFVISYPLFSLDQIGLELQNPFDVKQLSHLPLDEITDMIQGQLLSYLNET